MPEIHGRLGAIHAPTGLTDFASVTFSRIGTTLDYVIQDAAVRILRAFTETSVLADFTPSSGTIASLKRPAGVITMAASVGATMTVTTANSAVVILASVAGFTDWTLTLANEIVDTSTFGASFRQSTAVLKGWSARAQRFWVDENFTVDVGAQMKALGSMFVVSLFVDTTGANLYRYVGFAGVEGVDLSVPVAGMVDESITFRGHKDLYYRDAST